jgi:hypothetical protein
MFFPERTWITRLSHSHNYLFQQSDLFDLCMIINVVVFFGSVWACHKRSATGYSCLNCRWLSILYKYIYNAYTRGIWKYVFLMSYSRMDKNRTDSHIPTRIRNFEKQAFALIVYHGSMLDRCSWLIRYSVWPIHSICTPECVTRGTLNRRQLDSTFPPSS